MQLERIEPPRNAAAAPVICQMGATIPEMDATISKAGTTFFQIGAAASGTVLAILRMYKRWVSPMLPSACRFYPTCSEYMMAAIEKHGLARGVRLGLRRLLRCHPFHAGGFDPVR